jgi:DNA modification methylase
MSKNEVHGAAAAGTSYRNEPDVTSVECSTQEAPRRWEPLYGSAVPSKRSGALFNAFSYPTKISAESVALFIAAHTKPGDVVLDPFAGSGSTGIAAKLCAQPTDEMIESAKRLGLDLEWGPRNAVLYELSTIGSLLAETLCSPPDPDEFQAAAQNLIGSVEEELGWMYEAVDPHGEPGRVRHIIWSDLLVCPNCSTETTFWDACVRLDPARINGSFVCGGCRKTVAHEDCEHATEDVEDPLLSNERRQIRVRVPVRVHGISGRTKWQRLAEPSDHEVIAKSLAYQLDDWVPTSEVFWGDLHRKGYHKGIDRYHHFYTHRNLAVISRLWHKIPDYPEHIRDALRLLVLSFNASHATLMTRVVAKKGQKDLVLTGAQSGVLYVSSLPVEKNIFEGVRRKVRTFVDAFRLTHDLPGKTSVINESSTRLDLPSHSIDYVFTDPPFGAYIPYAELNQLNEAWLDKLTDRAEEAIVSPAQGKSVDSYRTLLQTVFAEISRVLDPAGVATVVFHSSKPSVWDAVGGALDGAGLNIVTTSVLEKTQLSFKQATTATSSRGDALILVRPTTAMSPGGGTDNRSDLHVLQQVFARAMTGSTISEMEPERLYSRYVGLALERGIPPTLDTAAVYKFAEPLSTAYSSDDGNASTLNPQDVKRLGQYFSGEKVARLLAVLADPDRVTTAIDPMAGRGDMLVALLALGSRLDRAGAIEIEKAAYEIASERLDATQLVGEHQVVHGSAFDPRVADGFGLESWDLVITNPPYVRYQTGSAAAPTLDLPSADTVRRGLVSILTSETQRRSPFMRFLAESAGAYSGLADLAVPSWLLCAAFVRPGGTLAMVVPDTWLTRDYAAPVRELLERFFEVEFVVEDADASWFPDALVRTNLVVARRRRDDADGDGDPNELHVKLPATAGTPTSLVGAVYDGQEPERSFATAAKAWRAGAPVGGTGDVRVELVQTTAGTNDDPQVNMPRSVAGLIDGDAASFCALDEYGWSVGQGLRTGANAFFYVEVLGDDGETILVKPDSRFAVEPFRVPHELVRQVLRRQAELPLRGLVRSDGLTGGVLMLQDVARPQDVAASASNLHRAMSPELASYVSSAETTNLGSETSPRFVPEFSAVRTNARGFEPSKPKRAARFWYQLPPLAQRHTPDLLIPRVNNLCPRVVVNPGREVIVDANFSTLWASEPGSLDPHAMLAVLSSDWSHAVFEASATRMAGGALKLEAAHLRRLPLPASLRDVEQQLVALGRRMIEGSDQPAVREEINEIIRDSLGLSETSAKAIADLAVRLQRERSR